MKKNIFVFLMIFVLIKGKAQFFVAEDFNLTDVWGINRNLYYELEQGKTIVLNFFITICGTCQINTPILESVWQDYGFNGDSLCIWGLESSGKSDNEILEFMNLWNVTFPCFSTANDDVVTYVYNITYTPQYFVICPNKMMKQVPITQIESAINGCKLLKIDNITKEYNYFLNHNEIIVLSDEYFDLQIFDVFGRKVKEINSAYRKATISDLKQGIYVFLLKIKHHIFSEVIVKY